MFITFEGGEGSGKTTQIKHLANKLTSFGYKCVVTREPGGTEIGMKIRAILLDPAHKNMDPRTELLLFMASRASHQEEVIKPGLTAEKFVLCDRYEESSEVYQGVARGLGADLVRRTHEILSMSLKPDLVILLDLPAHIGLERALGELSKGGNGHVEKESRIDKENWLFHEKIRGAYLEQWRENKESWFCVDASKDENTVADRIWKEVQKRFLKK